RDSAPELVDEACELADTGRAVLSGERPGDARALAAQRRTLVSALLQEARRVLTAAELDVSAATERQVVETLDAALVSPDVAELLAVGRLLTATTATGFEGLISVDNPFALTEPSDEDAPRPKLKVLKGGKHEGRPSADGDDDDEADDGEAEAAAAALLEQRRAETAAAAEKANARLEEVQVELEEATAALSDVQQKVQDAEQALVAAQAAAKDAEHRLAEVQERLEAAEADADEAEQAAEKAAART
ncbi:hypothetical protein B7486_53585, partial [cyanobacterium TDX16]